MYTFDVLINTDNVVKYLDSIGVNDYPDEFEDCFFIPSVEDIKGYSVKQIHYLLMSANIDESDAIGTNRYKKMKKRNKFIKKLVKKVRGIV